MCTPGKSLLRNLVSAFVLCWFAQAALAQDLPSPTATIGDPIVGAGDAFSGFSPGPAASPTPSGEAYVPGEYFEQTNWYNPTTWFAGPHWEKAVELGINGSEGNAQAFSLLTAGRLKRDTERSTWGIDVVYAKTEANDITYAFGIASL